MYSKINIKGVDKAALLMAFYNAAKPVSGNVSPLPMTRKMASELIETMPSHQLSFDIIYGRALKIDITEDVLYTYSFDALYGEGAAKRCVWFATEQFIRQVA